MTKVRKEKTTGDDLLQLAARTELHPSLNEENAHKVDSFDHVYSIVDVFGRVWAVGGVIENTPGVFEAWTVVDPEAVGKKMGITRLAKEIMDEHPAKEIEAFVQLNFDRGHQFVGMLGFILKAPHIVREGQTYARYILSKKDET